jgi:hypothetical protein
MSFWAMKDCIEAAERLKSSEGVSEQFQWSDKSTGRAPEGATTATTKGRTVRNWVPLGLLSGFTTDSRREQYWLREGLSPTYVNGHSGMPRDRTERWIETTQAWKF